MAAYRPLLVREKGIYPLEYEHEGSNNLVVDNEGSTGADDETKSDVLCILLTNMSTQ